MQVLKTIRDILKLCHRVEEGEQFETQYHFHLFGNGINLNVVIQNRDNAALKPEVILPSKMLLLTLLDVIIDVVTSGELEYTYTFEFDDDLIDITIKASVV